MQGQPCPQCDRDSDWISTANQWEYKCMSCEIRFNRDGEIYAGEKPMMVGSGNLRRALEGFWRIGW